MQLLDVTQFCYNLKKSYASNHSPFELATGQQRLTLHTNFGILGKVLRHTDLLRSGKRRSILQRSSWIKQQSGWRSGPMRRDGQETSGDLVLVKLQPSQQRVYRQTVSKGQVRKRVRWTLLLQPSKLRSKTQQTPEQVKAPCLVPQQAEGEKTPLLVLVRGLSSHAFATGAKAVTR